LLSSRNVFFGHQTLLFVLPLSSKEQTSNDVVILKLSGKPATKIGKGVGKMFSEALDRLY
jgi:hypothetical protein